MLRWLGRVHDWRRFLFGALSLISATLYTIRLLLTGAHPAWYLLSVALCALGFHCMRGVCRMEEEPTVTVRCWVERFEVKSTRDDDGFVWQTAKLYVVTAKGRKMTFDVMADYNWSALKGQWVAIRYGMYTGAYYGILRPFFHPKTGRKKSARERA